MFDLGHAGKVIKYGITDLHYNEDKTVCCWNANKQYRIQTYDITIAAWIRSWSFTELTCSPMSNNAPWVFGIKKNRKKLEWVCKKLGLPLPSKSPGRVKHGKKPSKTHFSKGNIPKQSKITRVTFKRNAEQPRENQNKAISGPISGNKGVTHDKN